MKPDVKYRCLCPRVSHREDVQIDMCGTERCLGISIFRKRFLERISGLKKFQKLPRIFTQIGCNIALYSTAEICEKEGYRISFCKYEPVFMKFECEYCDREETNVMTPEGKVFGMYGVECDL